MQPIEKKKYNQQANKEMQRETIKPYAAKVAVKSFQLLFKFLLGGLLRFRLLLVNHVVLTHHIL